MTFGLTLSFIVLVFLRPQDWVWSWLSGWPLLDAVIYAAVIMLFVEGQGGRVRLQRTPAIQLTIGLFIAAILSHVPHTYFQGILNTIPVAFKACFFLLMLLFVLNTIQRAKLVIILIVGSACIMAIHALMQQKTGHGFIGQEPIYVYTPQKGFFPRTMFFGIFADPNDLAQMLVAALPLAFAIPRRINIPTFAPTIAVAVLLFLAIISTHSRGGMVALIATAGAMAMLTLPPRWMPWLIVAGLVAFLVACAYQSGVMMDASARERVMYWGLANYAFKSNPLFGVGFGMFWQVAGERAAHNAFVTCYTEMGLVGYWFWFNLLVIGVLGCWRTRVAFRRPKNGDQAYMKRMAGLGIASLVGFSAGAYFLSRTFVFPYIFLIGIVNVIPLIARRYLPENHPPLIDAWRDVMVAGTLATIGSVIYVYLSIVLLNRAGGG